MKKISILRVNFSGTIGTLDGSDMNAIAEKISIELVFRKCISYNISINIIIVFFIYNFFSFIS